MVSNGGSYDGALQAIPRMFPRLTSLSINFRKTAPMCWWITDQGVSALSALSKLQHLRLPWCANVTGETLFTVGALQILDLSYSASVQDKALANVLSGSPMLQQLNISGCKLIKDSALQACGASCFRLKALQMAMCEQVTNAGACAVAKGCLELTFLNVTGCPKVTSTLHEMVALKAISPFLKIVKHH